MNTSEFVPLFHKGHLKTMSVKDTLDSKHFFLLNRSNPLKQWFYSSDFTSMKKKKFLFKIHTHIKDPARYKIVYDLPSL